MCDKTNPSKVREQMYGTAFAGIYGYYHFTGCYSGGQAEYVRVPKASVNLLKIPNSVSDEKARYLSDIMPAPYHAIQCTEVQGDTSAAIRGLGLIGLCAVKWCKLAGADPVIAIDTVAERLAKAKSIGCEVIDLSCKVNVYNEISARIPGKVDSAIDAAGLRFIRGVLDTIQSTWPNYLE